MEIAVNPRSSNTGSNTGSKTSSNSGSNNWRAQRNELRGRMSALLCCELLPLPEVEHAALCTTFKLALAAYLTSGSHIFRRARRHIHRQRNAERRKLLIHLLIRIDESSSRLAALCNSSPDDAHHKASFCNDLVGCCRLLQLRFVLEEQLHDVLQESTLYERGKYRILSSF